MMRGEFYFSADSTIELCVVEQEKVNKAMENSSDNSSVTSIDDNTENFVENPTRELLAEGFLGFFTPIVENLDTKVKQTQ